MKVRSWVAMALTLPAAACSGSDDVSLYRGGSAGNGAGNADAATSAGGTGASPGVGAGGSNAGTAGRGSPSTGGAVSGRGGTAGAGTGRDGGTLDDAVDGSTDAGDAGAVDASRADGDASQDAPLRCPVSAAFCPAERSGIPCCIDKECGVDFGQGCVPASGRPCSKGDRQCKGDQPQVCSAYDATWANDGGLCGYGCDRATAACTCTAPASRYTVSGTGPNRIVTDMSTGYRWSADTNFGTWQAANAACLAMGGSWHLPTALELGTTLVQQAVVGPPQRCATNFDPTVYPSTPTVAPADASQATFWVSDAVSPHCGWNLYGDPLCPQGATQTFRYRCVEL